MSYVFFLVQRPGGTRKWPINMPFSSDLLFNSFRKETESLPFRAFPLKTITVKINVSLEVCFVKKSLSVRVLFACGAAQYQLISTHE